MESNNNDQKAANPFELLVPRTEQAPIIITVPHSGTFIPEHDQALYKEAVLNELPDTDWLVDNLYDFARDRGIALLRTGYSRYFVDLNRSSQGSLSHEDGRRDSGVVLKETLLGDRIYRNKKPSDDQILKRLETVYFPFHSALQQELDRMRTRFDHIVLVDAHSIFRMASNVSLNPLPDVMLGDCKGDAASPLISQAVRHLFQESDYSFNYNRYFSGGYITKNYGNPAKGIHALQLVLAQDIYLDSTELTASLDVDKQAKLQDVLGGLWDILLNQLDGLPSTKDSQSSPLKAAV